MMLLRQLKQAMMLLLSMLLLLLRGDMEGMELRPMLALPIQALVRRWR